MKHLCRHVCATYMVLLAGDIQENPGPVTDACAVCTKGCRKNQMAIQCDSCDKWFHAKCISMKRTEYDKLCEPSLAWECITCLSPYGGTAVYNKISSIPGYPVSKNANGVEITIVKLAAIPHITIIGVYRSPRVAIRQMCTAMMQLLVLHSSEFNIFIGDFNVNWLNEKERIPLYNAMEEQKEGIVGFLHNVSPTKKSSKTSYFDMSIQTTNGLVRGVCFSGSKQEHFDQMSKKKSPIKLRNFRIERAGDATTVLMNNNVLLEPTKETPFSRIELPSFAYLVDPHGAIKVTLWEQFCGLEEGKTYNFQNLQVKKEYNSNGVYLSTPKTGCTITEVEPFSQPLINPAELPQNFTNTTAAAEILGVQSVDAYQSCCNCNKKLVIETSPILTCSTCGLKQNMKSTIEQCYVQLLVQIKESKITVTLFNDILHDMLASQGKSTLPITEETITAFLLELPTITSITFNNKTKIVESVQI
ncbi:uncharacterized protein [Pocillopora verrucosa]|uniref:uncharacterized protein n=1 Tax=Pocillopora verrucosa TaxID=203993 RepID=UPI00333E5549